MGAQRGDITCLRLHRKSAVGPRTGLRYLTSVPRLLCLDHNACFYFLSINAMSNVTAVRANRKCCAMLRSYLISGSCSLEIKYLSTNVQQLFIKWSEGCECWLQPWLFFFFFLKKKILKRKYLFKLKQNIFFLTWSSISLFLKKTDANAGRTIFFSGFSKHS